MISILRVRFLGICTGLAVSIVCGPVARAADTTANVAPAEAPLTHWADIKADTYEQRAHFLDGAKRLLVRLDAEIAVLKAKRAVMITDTSEWDFSMKDV